MDDYFRSLLEVKIGGLQNSTILDFYISESKSPSSTPSSFEPRLGDSKATVMLAVSYKGIVGHDFIVITSFANIGRKTDDMVIKIALYKLPAGYNVNEGAFQVNPQERYKRLILTMNGKSNIVVQMPIFEKDFEAA